MQPDNPLIAALEPITSRVRTDATAIKLEDGSRWTQEPLTPHRLAKHLNGGPARGCCPIKPGESSTMLALLDLDSHRGEADWPEMAHAAGVLAWALSEHGIETVPFRSSGGRGIHLYCLWDSPQDAYSVRQAILSAIGTVGFRSGAGKGVAAKEVEIFPKQDSVPDNGFGNQFILPLAGKSVPLDPETFEPLDKSAALTLRWPVSAPVAILQRPERAATFSEPREGLDTLREALAKIPNDADNGPDYDEWRNIIFAIHYETEGDDSGLALAHEFSARSPKYDPDFLDNRIWPYIDSARENPITGSLILARAREASCQSDISAEFDDLTAGEEGQKAERDKLARFAPQQIAEFAVQVQLSWLIKGVLAAADLIVIYGASGSGKSFMALDMCMSIARGIEWRGCKVRKGRVLYVAAEGANGVRNRLRAYAEANQIPLEDIDMYAIGDRPNLLERGDVSALIASMLALGDVSLVVFDTFAQVMPGGNENSGEDVGRVLSSAHRIRHETGATVALIHHCGKDPDKGSRGWSGLKGAADCELEVIRADNARCLTVTKLKDGGDEGAEFGFELETVVLGQDADGDDITSCVVRHTATAAKEVRRRAKPIGPIERAVLNTFNTMCISLDDGVPIESVLSAVIEQMDAPEEGKRDRRKEAAGRAVRELLKGGHLKESAGKLLVPERGED